MDLISISIGVFIGFFLGVGGTLFYIKWKMQAQLSSMEEQMGALMDATGDMSGIMDDLEVETEEVDDKEPEEE